MRDEKLQAGEAFTLLKSRLAKWGERLQKTIPLKMRDEAESLWMVAGQNESSEELNARLGLNLFLTTPSIKKRDCAVARFYAPELPGASAYIFLKGRQWRIAASCRAAGEWRKEAAEGGKETGPAAAAKGGKRMPGLEGQPLTEKMFLSLISLWLNEFLAGKNFSYKH